MWRRISLFMHVCSATRDDDGTVAACTKMHIAMSDPSDAYYYFYYYYYYYYYYCCCNF